MLWICSRYNNYNHYISGSKEPVACTSGHYTNSTHQSVCHVCPEGYYCLPVNVTDPPYTGYNLCPQGFYCPNGTGLNWKKCPAGTYSNRTGLSRASQCIPCPEGKYCDGTESTTFSGSCDGGYYCTSGVDVNNPTYNESYFNCSNHGLHTGRLVVQKQPPEVFCKKWCS